MGAEPPRPPRAGRPALILDLLCTVQSSVGAEELATSERQYLARCFDLLHMELTAVRLYIAGLR